MMWSSKRFRKPRWRDRCSIVKNVMNTSGKQLATLLGLAAIRMLLASDLSLDVDTGNALHLVHDPCSPVAAVVSNASSSTRTVGGRLEVRDWKGRGFSMPVADTLPSGKAGRYPLPGSLPAKGFYRISLFEGNAGKPVASTSFAFVERHDVTPLLAKPKFRFGFTDHPLYYSPEERRLLYDAFVASGAKLARVGLAGFGDVLSGGEGCFDWRESDEGIEAFRSRGISINATIYGRVPRWAAESNRVANCIRDKVEWAIGCMPPREGLFRDYCRVLAARYGTRIDYYEIGNEFDMVPRWILPPEVALRLQREAWEGIKEACPAACVTTCGWAVGGSDDYYHKGKRLPNLGIMEEFLEKGQGWFDVLPVHLHGSFENYETRLNSRFFPLLKRYGVKQPWYSNETADHISGGREVPVAVDVWRKILYAWAHGSTDYTWYNLRAKAGRAGAGVEWAYGVMTHDWHPMPAFASFCALAAIFNGLDFECAHADVDKLKVYRFKGGDRIVLVGWTAGDAHSAVHLATDAHGAELYDVMGQRMPVTVADGKFEWDVSAEPAALVLSAATQLKVDCRFSSGRGCGDFPKRGLIAHRGDVDEFPESTIPAFRSAVAKGAEMIELDEWRCKTGELVVMHDPSVDRTTDGKGRIADLTLAEIKSLDAGVKRGPQFAGLKVLTLDEALAVFPKTGLYLNIHCKTGDAAPEVADLLRRTGRLAQGILMMDDPEALAAVRSQCPWAKTGLVMNTDAGWAKPWTEDEAWRKLKAAADAGVEFVQILPNCVCTKEQFAYLHERGIRTTYFVANDEETLRQKVAEGHDFVFTDRYSPLRAVYARCRETARMMTFNIWGDYFGNPPNEREDGVADAIVSARPDIIALQEVTPNWWRSALFPKLDKAGYAVIKGNEAEAFKAACACGIAPGRLRNHVPLLYRKERYRLVDCGFDVFHARLEYNKGLTWAVLEDRNTGGLVVAASTHFWWQANGRESDAIREQNAQMLIWRVRSIKWMYGDVPVVVGGDLNSKPGSWAYEILEKEGFVTAAEAADDASKISSHHGNPKRDGQGRYRGTLREKDNTSATSIDHVLVGTNRVHALRHAVVTEQGVLDVSDHSPVVVDFEAKPAK